MSKIITFREQKIKERIDRIFGNSPQVQELKSIALKSALGELTEEDGREFWENKQRDLEEIKARMPVANDLCLPTESITIVGAPLMSNALLGESQYIVNGSADVSGQREIGGSQNPTIKHEVVFGNFA